MWAMMLLEVAAWWRVSETEVKRWLVGEYAGAEALLEEGYGLLAAIRFAEGDEEEGGVNGAGQRMARKRVILESAVGCTEGSERLRLMNRRIVDQCEGKRLSRFRVARA
jgi:hypothetical protein